jgi:uncharacterized cupredoxin-like copper-binding protein
MLPAHVRRALPFFILVLVGLSMTASAAAPPAEPVIEVVEYDFGLEPSGVELTPGASVTFHLLNKGQVPHNLFIGEEGAVAKYEPTIEPGGSAVLNFTVPETGHIIYYCAVSGHRELGMVGNLTVKGTVVAGPAGEGGPTPGEIRSLGVSYFAYWVGVVSFIILFVVLAATFFLLRYGESKHWTDQKDRPVKDKGEAPKAMTGTWIVLGLVLIVFVVAAVQVMRVV